MDLVEISKAAGLPPGWRRYLKRGGVSGLAATRDPAMNMRMLSYSHGRDAALKHAVSRRAMAEGDVIGAMGLEDAARASTVMGRTTATAARDIPGLYASAGQQRPRRLSL